jgi:hypothetical protein
MKINYVGQIMEMSDMPNTFEELGWYFMTVFMGFLIQGIILYPTLYGEMYIIYISLSSCNFSMVLIST